MMNEILIGLWKMAWFFGPIFGVLLVGGIYEYVTKRN